MNRQTRSTPASHERALPPAAARGRGGPVPARHGVSPPQPDPLSPPLWRIVHQFWLRALILSALVWLDAMFDRRGTIGGPGSEPHAYLIPIATLLGGAAALGIASRTRIVVADRRSLYVWWTAPAVVMVLLTGVGRSGLHAEPITNVVIQGGIVVFATFLITVGVLAHEAKRDRATGVE